MQRDGSEVGINVRVIVFERREDQFVGMIVQEFRSAVEERGFVFVAFDDEFLAAAEAVAAIAEIRSDAADQEIRLAPRYLKNPGEHRGGGGFSVRAGDDDRGVPRNEIFLEQLRHGAVRQFFVEDVFDFRIAARDRVADHAEVRRRLQIFFAKSFVPADAEGIEQRGSGRIDVDVRAGDVKAALFQHSRDRSHGGAGDSEQMDVFRVPIRIR